jgi:hypothetical protein
MTEEKTEAEEKTFWALDLSLDLYDCDIEKFNIECINDFGKKIGEFLDPDAWNSIQVSEFGKDEELLSGFRMVHETHACLITSHFVNKSKKAYINIHSCQPYKPTDAIELCGDFFDTTKYACKKNMRD